MEFVSKENQFRVAKYLLICSNLLLEFLTLSGDGVRVPACDDDRQAGGRDGGVGRLRVQALRGGRETPQLRLRHRAAARLLRLGKGRRGPIHDHVSHK